MEPKVILIVSAPGQQHVFERSLKDALDRERVRYEFVHSDTAANAERTMHEAGYPDFVVCEKDAGYGDAGIDLLRKVRHAGESMPFVVWSRTLDVEQAELVAALSGIAVTWDRPGGLARLSRYAVTLLHTPRRNFAS